MEAKGPVSVWMPLALAQDAKRAAGQEGRSRSSLIVELVQDYLAGNGRENKPPMGALPVEAVSTLS